MIYDETPKDNIEKTFDFKENRVLFEKLKSGDKKAKEDLIYYNLKIIKNIINRNFIFSLDNNLLDYEDLFMIGVEGLIKAINNFDLEKNFNFSTYAYKCIKNEILKHLKKNYKILEISIEEKLEQELEMRNNFIFKYLNTNEDITTYIEDKETMKELKITFENLTPYEKKIISLFYGINTEKLSSAEIGKILGRSQSYCNKTKQKVLKKMNQQLQKNNS